MNTSSMKQSGMVFESNALLKVNGWVPVFEAFAHAIIENNYFAWLYDYKK
jgi:hypothetical protein